MRKLFLVLIILFLPLSALAQSEQLFKARAVEIVEQQEVTPEEGGAPVLLQKVKMIGLEGAWQDQEIIFDGIEYQFVGVGKLSVGDQVVVSHTVDGDGADFFVVIDFVRQSQLLWLAFLFVLFVGLIGRLKGLRAVATLVLTFVIILKFIVPQIMAGHNPLLISIVGSLFILVIVVYVTEGFKRDSTIAIGAIVGALVLTGILSVIFTKLTHLTGLASEDAMFVLNYAGNAINLRGLLLAGVIISALGVLDDIVIAQVATVRELKLSNPAQSTRQIYTKAMNVGVSHLSSMVNTLFLAYAGASLPLLILFQIKEPPFATFAEVINNELIATEIVRTLTASIGLVLSVPIATLAAAYLVRVKKYHEKQSLSV